MDKYGVAAVEQWEDAFDDTDVVEYNGDDSLWLAPVMRAVVLAMICVMSFCIRLFAVSSDHTLLPAPDLGCKWVY